MTKFLRRLNLLVAAALVTSHVSADSAATDVWPQWRGPARDVQIAQSTWPEDLSEQRLAMSCSAPVGLIERRKSGKRILRDPTNRVVSVFDRQEHAEAARRNLIEEGFSDEEVRVVHGK